MPHPLRRARERLQLGLWHSLDRLARRRAGGDARPPFHDIDRTCPELRAIDRDHDRIDAELTAILPRLTEIPRYQDVDPKQREISSAGAGSWRTFFLFIRGGERAFPNAGVCPRTTALLASIPSVGQAFFSILEPGKPILPHCGPHHYYLRHHHAFRVPARRPPVLRVQDQHYVWREGESVLFDDSLEHEVLNDSDAPRVVLVTDVVRPDPAVRALYRLTHGLAGLGVSEERWRAFYAPFEALPASPESPATAAAPAAAARDS